nr:hypothetical protein CFP56_34579 [Quercus suber]
MVEPRPKHRVLSREEEAEISRSKKKKVKDVHHAGFNDGTSEGGSSQWHQAAWGSPKKSFKDKLVGKIPGAFAKAFDFTDLMVDEAESDDEMLDLHERLAAVKLSRETKLRIRSPWAVTLIIKPFGKAVGFNFLQSKFNLLWKPSGRIDLVGLGHGFYSVRFSLKEDLNAVLEKEVLRQIRDSIGKVLRIDSHTATEARGEYARVGHRKEVCLYTIRNPKSPEKGVNDEHEKQPVNSHATHATDSTNSGSGMSNGNGADKDNDLYGPWMIVTHRKIGRRRSRNATVMEGPTDLGMKTASHEIDQVGPSFVGFTANQLEASGTIKMESNTNTSPSVRGKKGLARNRASSSNSKRAADSKISFTPKASQSWSWKSADSIRKNSNAPFKFAASF